MKRKASNCLNERHLKFIHQEVQTQKHTIDILTNKDIKYIRDNTNRAKGVLPRLPQTAEHVYSLSNAVVRELEAKNC